MSFSLCELCTIDYSVDLDQMLQNAVSDQGPYREGEFATYSDTLTGTPQPFYNTIVGAQ